MEKGVQDDKRVNDDAGGERGPARRSRSVGQWSQSAFQGALDGFGAEDAENRPTRDKGATKRKP